MILGKENTDQLAQTIMKFLSQELETTDGDFHWALSGGRTPLKIFEYIREHFLDWPYWFRIHFWWGDERLVPPDSEESNAGLASRILLNHLPIRSEQIHRVKGEFSREDALKDYNSKLSLLPKDSHQRPYFHWNLLGMGSDGHTASIFPDYQQWDSLENLIVVKNPYNQQERISLTPSMIYRSQFTTFLVTGIEKATVLRQILENKEEAKEYPAYKIQSNLQKKNWLCDKAALSMIHGVPLQD